MPLPRFVDYSLRFIAPISLGLAIYYHYQSAQERVPTFYVSPTRARIVDTSIPAPAQVQVLYKGKGLNANVSAAVVYFWNDGKFPIKADDVLGPVRIVLDPTCEIIDARILKVSRGVTKFAKGEISDTAKNSLPLSFGILERNDGAALQIIYSGKADTSVLATGTIVGAGSPHKAIDRIHQDPVQMMALTMITSRIVFVSAAATGILLVMQRQRIAARFGKTRFRLAIAFVVLTAITYGAVAVVDYQASQPVVPANLWTKD